MDLLRSCYTAPMKFFTDSDVTVNVRWFWCPDDARPFPSHHRFGSANWDSDRLGREPPGEVTGVPHPYDKGKNSGVWWGPFLAFASDGKHFCGPLSGFTDGTPYPGVPLGTDSREHSQCCLRIPPILWLRILQVFNGPPHPYGHVGDVIPMFWNGDIESSVWFTRPIFPTGLPFAGNVIGFGATASGPAMSSIWATPIQNPDIATRVPFFFHWPLWWPRMGTGPPQVDERWECTVSDIPPAGFTPGIDGFYFPTGYFAGGYLDSTFP